MSSCIVVGAGLSGLACAHRLAQAGVEVTVLERGAEPGGRARTERHGQYLIDTGPDAMSGGYVRYRALMSELGMADRIVPSSSTIGWIRDGRLLDVDAHKPWQLIRTPALSMAAKRRLVIGRVRIHRMLRGVDPYSLERSFALDEAGTSADAFGRRHFGDEVTDYLIDPITRLVVGIRAPEASLVNVLGAFNGWLSPLISVRGGLGLLPTALAKGLDVRYRCPATSVQERGDHILVTCTEPDGAESELEADACVITAMYGVATQLWPRLRDAHPPFGRELRHVKLICVTLGYRVPTDSRAYVVQVPTRESADVLLMLMQHNKAPDRAPRGHSLITVYTDTAVTDDYLSRSDDELARWAAGWLEKWCPELAGHRELSVVSRWPQAAYLATPGFWRRSDSLYNALPAGGRVQIAGDLFSASSMESAIRWGERAAERVVAAITSSHTESQPMPVD
jgi:protoporphyrinogen/coproporphyrinogen III oxidase